MIKRRVGWGGIRAALVASTQDVLAVQVTGLTRRIPTLVGASFLIGAPGPDPGQEAGYSRLVVYSGNEPQGGDALLPSNGTPLEGGSYASRVWADMTIRYGNPLIVKVAADVQIEPSEDLWAVLGCPIDLAGAAFDAIAAITLWGKEC